MRRILVCLTACVLLVGGCSDDDPEAEEPTGTTAPADDGDDGDEPGDDRDEPDDAGADEPSGDVAAFCEFLATEDVEVDPLSPEGQEMMAQALESAPDEIRDDLETIFELFERMEGMDESDLDDLDEVFALMFDPEIMAASQAIEEFGVEECGMDTGWFDEGTAQEEATTGGDDDDDDDRTLSEQIEDWVEENQPGAEWLDPIVSWTRINDKIQLGGEFDDDRLALRACAAVVAWATDTGRGEVDVTVTDLEGNTLAEATDSGLCEAA